MSLFVISIVAVGALCLVMLMSISFYIFSRKHKEKTALLDAQVQSATFLVNELQRSNAQTKQELIDINAQNAQSFLENSQVSQQLEHRIKNLQNQVVEQEQRLTQWQENQGQDKFYSRAFKLAEKGADIDEIISECELPRAEVEMLLSVYQQRSK